MYDVIIIGAGPAGMSAAIYATRREMKTLIIGRETGGQVAMAGEIENYPGFKSVNNFDLIAKMAEQVKSLGAEIKNDEVKNIDPSTTLRTGPSTNSPRPELGTKAGQARQEKYFTLYTNREKFEAKTIIVAMGLSPRRLAIPGEVELAGKGVSYCANCDGPLFKNKTVAVVGGGNAALDAAEVLSKIAAKVYLIHRNEIFKAFEELVDEVKAKKNVEMILNSEVKEIIGSAPLTAGGATRVEKIKVLNNKINEMKDLVVDGVFIEVGRIASTDLVGDLVERNERNQIVVDEKCRTTCDGIFAAGDVTQVEFKQITIAVGQGTIAALAAYQYLQLKQGKSGMVLDRSVANHSVKK